ncbi:MAG: electron transport complex subunit RsxC [Lachnospiraceae bacterium]|nr:electron transport complex subunit RsxC [Lachnospiraceae bacterium]MBP5253845.1 electron transport complex subunit RsxC [Lachnospiraceae bacterium]
MEPVFSGGIRFALKKNLSAGKIGTSPVPETVVIPLKQHAGAAASPLVSAGDTVRFGQKIGDAEGLSLPVHASVSGYVEAVEERPCVGGSTLCVVIRNDGFDTPEPTLEAYSRKAQLTGQALRGILRDAGIAEMGGNGFPAYAKLGAVIGKADTLIVNACEPEPYVTADEVLLRNHCPEIIEGARLIRDAIGAVRAVIAVSEGREEVVKSLRRGLKDVSDVEAAILPDRYPQGADKLLVAAVTGREVPSGGLPMDAGCLVFNIATVYAITQAVYVGLPSVERYVSVTGEAVRRPRNLLVRVGTSFADLVEACGGLREDVRKIVAGGPMTGRAVDSLAVPVTKTTSAVVCLLSDSAAETARPSCVRCGKCVDACPVNLDPLFLYRYARTEDAEELKALRLMDCIECGACAYVCPGKLPLVETFRAGKKILKEAAV